MFLWPLKLLIYLRIVRVVIASNLLNLVAAAMSENTFLVIELWMLGTVIIIIIIIIKEQIKVT